MKVTRLFARRFRLLELLRGSLAVGGLCNLATAVALAVAPAALARGVRIALPEELAAPRVLALLAALLLAMLAALYLMAANDPRRYSGIVLVAIVGRLAGAALFGAAASSSPALAGLWPVAGLEAAFGFVHAATWIPLRA